jgi:hypothetical protein
VRCVIVLLALLSLHWSATNTADMPALLAAAALGGLALALGYGGHLRGWPALSVDSIATALLLYGTDRSGSPLLPLALLLILQGMLLGGSNGALAGGSAGVALLLMHAIEQRHPHGAIAADLALLQLVVAVVASRFGGRLRRLFSALREGIDRQQEQTDELDRVRQLMGWQRLNLQLAACTTVEQIVRLASAQAQQIAGASASVSLGPLAPGAATTRVPIARGDVQGAIVVEPAHGELSAAQHDALAHLAALVGLHVAELRHCAARERQQTALTALWEIAGLLRVAPGGVEVAREALARIAGALDLDWLALLSPDERRVLAPVVVARGCGRRGPPLISAAQLRVAAEALRGERSLVRAEDGAALVCLPVRPAGHAPLVIVARGDAGDSVSQTLLMLLGDLIAGQVLARPAGSRQ